MARMVSPALTRRKTLWGGPRPKTYRGGNRRNGLSVVSRFVVDYVNVQTYFDELTKQGLMEVGYVVHKTARQSIRVTKYKPSEPYKPARTRPSKIWKYTIRTAWDKRTWTCVTGHKYDRFHEKSAWRTGKPANGKRVPELLEYGGYKVIRKPVFMPKLAAPMEKRKKEVARLNKMLNEKDAQGNFVYKMKRPPSGKYTVSNLKTVPIWPGTYEVKPRPTMRLAWNKTCVQTNQYVIRAFRKAKIRNPQRLQKQIL